MIELPTIPRVAHLPVGGDSRIFARDLVSGGPCFGLTQTTCKSSTILETALATHGAIDDLSWCQYRITIDGLRWLNTLRRAGYIKRVRVLTSDTGKDSTKWNDASTYARANMPGALHISKAHLKGFAARFKSGAFLTVLTSMETPSSSAEWWLALPGIVPFKWLSSCFGSLIIPTLSPDIAVSAMIRAVPYQVEKNRVNVQDISGLRCVYDHRGQGKKPGLCSVEVNLHSSDESR
jgi:hypothetical protein